MWSWRNAGASARPGVAVGDAGGDALVEGEDVLELRVVLERVHERLLGRAGVAEDIA